MKKYSIFFSALFLIAAISCAEKESVMTTPEEGEGTVTFDMEVTIPESAILTRADCDDTPKIENIYVATYGNQGYLNEYVKAIPVDANGNMLNTYATTNSPDKYRLRVTLLATTSNRYVHIIANGPEVVDYRTTDVDLMLTRAMTTGYVNGVPQGAYWQYIRLPQGTSEWKNGKWVEGEDAKTKFGNIKLIRNFARITVRSTASNFTLDPDYGFHVFRTESEGSIAMPTSMEGKANFVDASRYASISNTDPLTDIAALPYSGFTPEGVELHDPIAKDNGDGITYTEPGVYQYVYESIRSYETSEEPFIIIRGKLNTDTKYSYYRIELTDEDAKYYSIFRNVDYTITITAVASSIVGSATAASARTCNGNVSTAVHASLPELSDGFQGLYVLYTDKTFVNTDKSGDDFVNKQVSFMYKYVKDIVNDPDTGSPATLSIISSGGAGHAIDIPDEDPWYTQTGPDADGWYTVKYNILPSAAYSSEASTVFRVTGKTQVATGVEQSIFRNITVRLIPIQTFKNIKVTGTGLTAGSTVNISFTLEDNLPASMFPLKVTVQDSELALNPVGTDMPLVVHDNGIDYHFYKTVTYNDYKLNKTVTCNMRLIQDIQASSLKIDVANEYFTPEQLSYTGQTE